MGEIIQFEGVAHKKVDRQPKHGDVVIARKSEGSSFLPNVPYKVYEKHHNPYVATDAVWEAPVYDIGRGRTEDTVDVYERIVGFEAEEYAPPVPESEQDKLAKHLAHPFYKDAHTYRELTRHGQIVKGAEKYDEPFTPSSWTALELLQHAMQENVDQAHYIYGMYQKVQEMEKELKELREFRDQVQKTVVKWGSMNEPKDRNA